MMGMPLVLKRAEHAIQTILLQDLTLDELDEPLLRLTRYVLGSHIATLLFLVVLRRKLSLHQPVTALMCSA